MSLKAKPEALTGDKDEKVKGRAPNAFSGLIAQLVLIYLSLQVTFFPHSKESHILLFPTSLVFNKA